MNNFNKIYYKLIFQQILNSIQQNILPQPFSQLLLNLKNAMLKAVNALDSQLKEINSEVNIWRDKLVAAWKEFSNILSLQQKTYLNNTLLDITNKYVIYMHGCNTGY